VSKNRVELILEDGTLVRHKVAGYEGRIEGTTKIQSCFTSKRRVVALSLRQTLVPISGNG
jgi:hypothetical protein